MKKRINAILHALNDNLYEREETIQLALLSTLAGESIFLLGPPGVAKSLIARRLKHIFKDGKSFEYLMNRFSTPDEIFGPISISKLKDEDKYERLTKAYFPDADIVFLDEIWKAGPSIQNALLTVVNEKVYRNGVQEIKLPLKGLLAASNELPAKGEGLGALWDRFIVRYLVNNISEAHNFNEFLKTNGSNKDFIIKEDLKITTKEFANWQKSINKIEISDEALNVINVIRSYIVTYNEKVKEKRPIYISDRRWLKIIKILKTSAFLNGRKSIDLMDCFLIVHCIWDEVEHIPIASEFVGDAIKKHGYSLKFNLKTLSKEIEELKLDIKNETKKTREIEYFEPKAKVIKKEEYFEILNPTYPLGRHKFISKSEFTNLNENSYKNCLLYSENEYSKSFNIKRRTDNKLLITELYFGGEGSEYNLETTSKIKNKTTTKRPHEGIIKIWDNKVVKLVEQTEKFVTDIKNYQKSELKGLKENMFVKKELSVFAENNLETTIKSLLEFKVESENLKKEYDKLT